MNQNQNEHPLDRYERSEKAIGLLIAGLLSLGIWGIIISIAINYL